MYKDVGWVLNVISFSIQWVRVPADLTKGLDLNEICRFLRADQTQVKLTVIPGSIQCILPFRNVMVLGWKCSEN
jgi:hypothetical protein